MSTPSATIYRAGLVVPSPVRDFFAVLAGFGTIMGVTESHRHGVTLNVSAPDEAEATRRGVLLAQSLGESGQAPAFPGDWHRLPSYRWQFDTPTYAGDGQWSILVPGTADLLHLLGVLSGMGEWEQGYRGERILPVLLRPADREDLTTMVSEIESELSAWFGEAVRLAEQR